MSRQEFPRVIKVAVIKRATCDNGVTYCEPGKLPARKWQIDHVIADAIGGKLVIENAELICEICYGIKPTGHNASREDKTARSEKSTTIIFMAMVESGTEPRRWRMTGIEIIVPASRAAWLLLRKLSIGASEIAALLNRHPWMTPFELWAEKSDLAPPVKETLDMELGAHIESVALKFLSKRRPDWIVTPNVIGEGGNFFLDRRAGLSCTPDAFVTPSEARGLGVCQVKKVSARVFREKWCNGGDPEVPSYVAIQVNQEAALTHATWGCVAALVIGEFSSEFYLLEVPLHAGVIARIHVEANKFWHRVAENDPPPPDYGRDGDIIRHIYAEDDGGEIDLSGNETVMGLLARREELKLIESAGSSAEKERAAIDRRLVHEFLGNAVRGMVGDGRVIEARTIRRAGYAVEPSHYRQVRIKAPREWSAAA